MSACWEIRGCDDEMMQRCPHNIEGLPCPADCLNTHCKRPTHDMVDPLDALMNPDVDRSAAVKEVCLLCRFFLEHGPVLEEGATTEPRMAARGLNVMTEE